MSAIHRVDDVRSMPAAKFFAFAWRLPCYRGVMRERVLREQRDREEASPFPAQEYQPSGYAAPDSRRPKLGTRAVIENDQVFQGIFSFGTASPAGSGTGEPDGRPDLREEATREYPELRP